MNHHDQVRHAIHQSSQVPIESIYAFNEVGSTNSFVLDKLSVDQCASQSSPVICSADHQTQGRGRRGRVWRDVPGSTVALSVGAHIPLVDSVSLLPIRAGLAVVGALEKWAAGELGLKWPNDVYLDSQKVGGILVESVQAGRGDHLAVVIGVGLNLLEVPTISDARNIVGAITARDGEWSQVDILGGLAKALIECLRLEGSLSSQEIKRWASVDELAGAPVRATLPGGEILQGVAAGLTAQGELTIDIDGGGRHSLCVGEVESVRPFSKANTEA